MAEPKSLEDKIRELKEQNSELVEDVQYWRMKYKECEDKRLSLMKENNELLRKRLTVQKIKSCYELLQEHACTSMKDILQITTHIENIGDIINEYEGNFETNSRETLSSHCTPGSSPSNIHHVRPMIGGVTLKTPILKVSRANLGIINRPTTVKNDIPVIIPPVIELNHRSTPTIEVQNLSVCLPRLNTIHHNRIASMRQSIGNNTNPNTTEESSINNNLEVDGQRDSHTINNVSVTLNQIDNEITEQTNSELNHEIISNVSNDENLDTPTQDEKSQSDDISFNNDEEIFNDYPQEEMKYSDRLTCIIEETTGDNTRSPECSIASSSKLLDKDYITPKKSSIINNSLKRDDPLEGPSWLFETRNNSSLDEKKNFQFVTSRKKEKIIQDESLFDSSSIPKDVDQVPDSTTDVIKDATSLDIISLPQCQSTPNLTNLEENKNDDSAKENNPSHKIIKGDKVFHNVKVILSRIRNSKTPQKRKAVDKKSKAHTKRACANNLFPTRHSKKSTSPIKTSPNKSSKKSIVKNNDSNSTMQSESFEPIVSNRPKRRTAKKDYKEQSIHKKLRR